MEAHEHSLAKPYSVNSKQGKDNLACACKGIHVHDSTDKHVYKGNITTNSVKFTSNDNSRQIKRTNEPLKLVTYHKFFFS